jgi:hypothetical protein
MADAPIQLSLVYNGRLANKGQLNFYEFSRAAYGFARLIGTIDVFRRTGRVPKKITPQMGVELIINAPEKGSFPIDIIAPLATEIGNIHSTLSGIPLDILVKYIFHVVKRLIPNSESRLIEIARIELRREQERTKQSKQETARVVELRKIVESGNATNLAMVNLLATKIENIDTRMADIGETVASLSQLKYDVEEIMKREHELEPYGELLSQIGEGKLAEITRKVRPQIAELGIPLNKSANVINVSFGGDRQSFARFDGESIDDIRNRELDEDGTTVELRFISYDRDGGYGKCDLNDLNRIELNKLSFSVPVSRRKSIKRKLILALDEDFVQCKVRFYRDIDGNITSLLIEEVFIDEESQ